jgi:hypothetical protein
MRKRQASLADESGCGGSGLDVGALHSGDEAPSFMDATFGQPKNHTGRTTGYRGAGNSSFSSMKNVLLHNEGSLGNDSLDRDSLSLDKKQRPRSRHDCGDHLKPLQFHRLISQDAHHDEEFERDIELAMNEVMDPS